VDLRRDRAQFPQTMLCRTLDRGYLLTASDSLVTVGGRLAWTK
jgi:hypothetical protein